MSFVEFRPPAIKFTRILALIQRGEVTISDNKVSASYKSLNAEILFDKTKTLSSQLLLLYVHEAGIVYSTIHITQDQIQWLIELAKTD